MIEINPHSQVARALAGIKRSRLSRITTSKGIMWALITPAVLARHIETDLLPSSFNAVYGRLLLSKTKLDSPRKLGKIFTSEKQEALYQEAFGIYTSGEKR